MQKSTLAASTLLIALCSGCASITGSEMQQVSLSTKGTNGQVLPW